MAAAAFGDMARQMGIGWDDATAFRRIIGDIDIHLSRDTSEEGALAQVENRRIKIFWAERDDGDRNYYLIPDVLLHELGHIFNANAGFGDKEGQGSINKTERHPNTWEGMGSPYPATLAPENKPDGSRKFRPWMEGIRPLHDILGLDEDDKLFRGVTLTVDQILLLRQSWAEDDTNEITADATLNWVFHRNTMRALGYTDDDEGKAWQKFMNDNMDVWTRNATVHNALQDEENIEFFPVRGMLPQVEATGTIAPDRGSKVRNIPSTAGRHVTTLSVGEEVLIFGRTEVTNDPFDWIAVLVKGDIRWIREDLIDLPDGVNADDLPVLDDDVGFEFDPNSPFEETTWFSQLVRHQS